MNQNNKKIVVCGHYGSTNIGDEAIGVSLIQRLKNKHPDAEITFLSYDPENTNKYLNVKSNYLLPLGLKSFFRGIFKGELFKTLKTIKNCDKFVLGGGGLFTDEKIFAVFLWGLHAFCAYRYKKPVFMIGQSIGPLSTKTGKWIVKKAFNKADKIIVRDSNSRKLLQNLNVKRDINIEPDLVFNLQINQNYKDENLNKIIEQNNLKGYFIVNLRPWHKNTKILYKKINQIIGQIYEKYKLLPVLVPFQTHGQNDAELMSKIIEQNNGKYPFLLQKFDQNIVKVLSVIKGADFTMGMRLHSLIFSMIQNVPIISLSYSTKINNLLSDRGLSDYIVDIKNPEQILEVVDKIMIQNKNN
jgi:polysaccharide pyruvyl transferase CsaB